MIDETTAEDPSDDEEEPGDEDIVLVASHIKPMLRETIRRELIARGILPTDHNVLQAYRRHQAQTTKGQGRLYVIR